MNRNTTADGGGEVGSGERTLCCLCSLWFPFFVPKHVLAAHCTDGDNSASRRRGYTREEF
jgi:hypothetical protein